MENTAKALQIAGGVLIAIILLALIIFTFTKMSSLPQAQEYQKEVEQISEFNMQYEAYQKKLMYGVDVISCLNKVLDNNRKSQEYANGKYDVKISIEITSRIGDEIKIFRRVAKKQTLSNGDTANLGSEVQIYSTSIDKTYKQLFQNAKESTQISSININNKVEAGFFESSKFKEGKTYSSDNENDLEALNALADSTVNMKQTATNPNSNDITNWSRVEWYTVAYNFKSKKFKCTNVGYNDEGRVNSISFVEL